MPNLKMTGGSLTIVLLAAAGTAVVGTARAQGLEGSLAGDRYGEALAWLGDVNGDGISDFAVGAPMGTGSTGRAGVVRVYLGGPGSAPTAPVLTLEGEVSGDGFGAAISAAGDVNDDGYEDYLVGAPGNDGAGLDAGRVYLFLGGDPPTAAVAKSWDGDLPGARFGASLAGRFDFNGDLFPDFAIGAPEYSGGAAKRGEVKIYLGSNTVTGITQPATYVLLGDQANWNLGYSLDPAGDVNGDGRGDLVAGAPQRFDLNPGRAVVWFGQTSEVSPPGRQVLVGEVGGDRFGWSVSGAGDFDHDLHEDLLVGAPAHDSLGVDKGAIYLFRGGPGFDGIADQVAIGATAGDSLGYALDGGFDRTGDGIPDLAAGAPGADLAGAGSGDVAVFRGGTSLAAGPDTVLAPVPPIAGFAAGDRFGAAVRFVGSIDGDALADLLVGAPSGNTSSGSAAGYADVFLGADGTVPVRLLAFSAASGAEGVRVSWDLSGSEELAGVALTSRSAGKETPFLTGWLPPVSGSWLDPSPSPVPATYRLWGLDRTGGVALLGETVWGGAAAAVPRLAASPNPFRAGSSLALTLPAGADGVSVVDVGGREIRRLVRPAGETGPLFWDGRDASGRAVPSGVYVIRPGGVKNAGSVRVVLLP